MLTLGSADVETLDDGWTVVTTDHSLAAHFEHTIAVTENGPVILTTA
jgi:methionyl aminopeptidase